MTVRSVFVIGPDTRIKSMITYPASTGGTSASCCGRSTGVQLTSVHNRATPVDWVAGQDAIIVTAVSDAEARLKYPADWRAPKPHLQIVLAPSEAEP